MKPAQILVLLGILSVFFVAGLFALDLFPTHRAVVLTVPSGALVSVGGAPPMTAPFSVPVHIGGTRLTISHEGYSPVDTVVTPGADTILVYLERLCGIALFTEPEGLTVTWEGFTAVSPCTIPLPGPGSYDILIQGERGIRDRVHQVLLAPELVTIRREVPRLVHQDREMVLIPGSLLSPGSPGILVGISEVTTAQFAAFMNSVDPDLHRTGSELAGRTAMSDSILRCNWPLPIVVNVDSSRYEAVPGLEDHPVYGVTQAGAELYCLWLSAGDPDGLEFRLPTPWEWQAAAGSGGSFTPVPGEFNCSDSSETILSRHPEINDGHAATAPVGSYPANPWGLYDTAGNVWEWTSAPGTAAGGSWLSSTDDCSPGTLAQFSPGNGYPFVGFRVVADRTDRNPGFD